MDSTQTSVKTSYAFSSVSRDVTSPSKARYFASNVFEQTRK
jgi:hypothetical protein